MEPREKIENFSVGRPHRQNVLSIMDNDDNGNLVISAYIDT